VDAATPSWCDGLRPRGRKKWVIFFKPSYMQHITFRLGLFEVALKGADLDHDHGHELHTSQHVNSHYSDCGYNPSARCRIL
jgi:hypothetical protein